VPPNILEDNVCLLKVFKIYSNLSSAIPIPVSVIANLRSTFSSSSQQTNWNGNFTFCGKL
jgi:hypothetical protein